MVSKSSSPQNRLVALAEMGHKMLLVRGGKADSTWLIPHAKRRTRIRASLINPGSLDDLEIMT